MRTKLINAEIKNNMSYPKLMVRHRDDAYVWFSSPIVGCGLYCRISHTSGKEFDKWDMNEFEDCEPGTKIEFNLED